MGGTGAPDLLPRPKDLLAIEGADHNDPALTVGAAMLDRIAAVVAGVVGGAPD
ncbi:MAG: hypothetical protein WEA29_03495 [Acidimicrobiia bacterium]